MKQLNEIKSKNDYWKEGESCYLCHLFAKAEKQYLEKSIWKKYN